MAIQVHQPSGIGAREPADQVRVPAVRAGIIQIQRDTASAQVQIICGRQGVRRHLLAHPRQVVQERPSAGVFDALHLRHLRQHPQALRVRLYRQHRAKWGRLFRDHLRAQLAKSPQRLLAPARKQRHVQRPIQRQGPLFNGQPEQAQGELVIRLIAQHRSNPPLPGQLSRSFLPHPHQPCVVRNVGDKFPARLAQLSVKCPVQRPDRLDEVTPGVPSCTQMFGHRQGRLACGINKSVVQQNCRVAAPKFAQRLIRVAQSIRKAVLDTGRRWRPGPGAGSRAGRRRAGGSSRTRSARRTRHRPALADANILPLN